MHSSYCRLDIYYTRVLWPSCCLFWGRLFNVCSGWKYSFAASPWSSCCYCPLMFITPCHLHLLYLRILTVCYLSSNLFNCIINLKVSCFLVFLSVLVFQTSLLFIIEVSPWTKHCHVSSLMNIGHVLTILFYVTNIISLCPGNIELITDLLLPSMR